MTIPGPNWFADPADAARQRWWTGAAWSEYTRSIAPTPFAGLDPYSKDQPAYQAAAIQERPAKRKDREKALRHNNPMAYAAALLALGSLIFNILVIPSILAIVFACIGFATANKLKSHGAAITGYGWCVAGLVIGILSGFYEISVLLQLTRSLFL